MDGEEERVRAVYMSLVVLLSGAQASAQPIAEAQMGAARLRLHVYGALAVQF